MKSEKIIRAIGGIDDDIIEASESVKTSNPRERIWIKWSFVAAAAILVIATGAMILPGMLKGNDPIAAPDTNGVGEGVGDPNYHGSEAYLYEAYDYSVDEGRFSSYVKGRVISDDKVAEKIADVTVTAGWVRAEGLPQAEKEHARAEIYGIKGVSADTAVAIKFLDKLEAQLTTCYYVIMNPDADLSPVEDYIIESNPSWMNDGGEIPE